MRKCGSSRCHDNNWLMESLIDRSSLQKFHLANKYDEQSNEIVSDDIVQEDEIGIRWIGSPDKCSGLWSREVILLYYIAPISLIDIIFINVIHWRRRWRNEEEEILGWIRKWQKTCAPPTSSSSRCRWHKTRNRSGYYIDKCSGSLAASSYIIQLPCHQSPLPIHPYPTALFHGYIM